MKKQSFHRGNRSFVVRIASLLTLPGGGVTAILMSAILVLVGIRVMLPAVFTGMTSPLLSYGSGLTASVGGFTNLESKDALVAERDALLARSTELQNQNSILSAKNTELTRLLGTRVAPLQGILAGVVSRPPLSLYDTLVLDAGAHAGVAVGALVRAEGGIPVGRITAVSPMTSTATLISTSGLETEGWIGDRKIPVMLTGDSAGTVTAHVVRGTSVAQGDFVYMVAGGAVPIGSISRVADDPASPNTELHIRLYVNPFTLTNVVIDRSAP